MKAFYYHHMFKEYVKDYHNRNGHAFLFTPSHDDRSVWVSVAHCSKKDSYCKRTAREVLLTKQPQLVNIRHIPQFVADVLNSSRIKGGRFYAEEMAYLWKYFL